MRSGSTLPRVKIVKTRDAFPARLGTVLFLLFTFLLTVAGYPLLIDEGFSLGAALVLVTVTLAISFGAWTQRWRDARVELVGGALVWKVAGQGAVHLANRSIEAALLVAPGVAVLRTRGSSYRLTVDAEDDGSDAGAMAITGLADGRREAATLRTLLAHVGAGTRDMIIPLRTASHAAFFAGVSSLLTFFAMILVAGALDLRHAMAAVILLPPAAIFLLGLRLGRSSMTLGSDGLRIAEGRRTLVVPYRSLRAVAVSRTVMNATPAEAAADTHVALLLHGFDGRERRVATTGNRAYVEAIGQRIHRAIEHHHENDGRVRPGDRLARGGRPIAEWRAQLEGSHDAFRTLAIPTEQLVDVLEDPYAPADQRVGAALVLRRHARTVSGVNGGDATVNARIRVAATTTREPALRAALEAAAEEEDDERLGTAVARAVR